MTDVSPLRAPKRMSADHSKFMGSRPNVLSNPKFAREGAAKSCELRIRDTKPPSGFEQVPRLAGAALQNGATRAEGLRRHAAHPELDALGFELDEDRGLVVGTAGKNWFQAGCQRARSSARSATITPRPIRVT